MYPEYDKLHSWVEHKYSNYIGTPSTNYYWYSFQDIPWQFIFFKNELTSNFNELKDNYLSLRFISVSYSKARDDCPQVQVGDYNNFYIKFEVVVKSAKKLAEYEEVIENLVTLPVEHTIEYSYNKESIGQRILYKAKSDEVIQYLKTLTPEDFNMQKHDNNYYLFEDDSFAEYCHRLNIDMSQINYTV